MVPPLQPLLRRSGRGAFWRLCVLGERGAGGEGPVATPMTKADSALLASAGGATIGARVEGERCGGLFGEGGVGEDAARVGGGACIAPDGDEVASHRERIAESMNFAARLEVPGDGNLTNRVPAQLSHVEQLNIESPPGDGLMEEQIERDLASQPLEAALCV